ncbi:MULTISPECIES: MaoC family dehydratase [unclassified Minwuia]|jgi:acyl dehydratase|uniref:MaoC family dehydratase n=1 Tax=unclassified Minwuia TaxID=2618799 RepID=UPI00247AD683|nr:MULTISPECIES: MaoC family dehydratase [unclassified Minwuia]
MAINYDHLMNYPIPDGVQDMNFRDAIIYALGIGLSQDQLDKRQLRYTYEDNQKVFPSMAVVLAGPGFWVKNEDTGVDWVKVLHGEQGMEIHKPIPVNGKLTGKSTMTEIIDKGAGKGALMYSERVVYDESGDKVCTLTSTTFGRGDGGFGGPEKPAPKPHALPDRAPDGFVDLSTRPEAALIYRLSGDYNPLHADPDVATAAGFKAPILHGLCSFGIACHALVKALCDYDGDRLKKMGLRFTSPVYPGETLRTEYWQDGNDISFRTTVLERDVVVLNNGYATIE